ncbi:MAG: SDR family oxidoreductase [Deltaproteobacteria bacterium]|nr:SDR family oxidoreductase [Deltaproteobacteria bacterium]
MDLRLKDKVALVTGVGSQIGYGKGIALTLAREGCILALVDIDLEGAEKTAAKVRNIGSQAIAIKADVTNLDEVDNMVKVILEKFGRVDILVNNAGASSALKPFIEMTRDEIDFNINVNLYGQINVAKAVLPSMLAQRYGRIVNFSGGMGIPTISMYGAAKAGIQAFTHSLAMEVGNSGVIVNCVFPGLGHTNLIKGATQEFVDMLVQQSALKRTCTPEDMGPIVAFLASDVCSYITGQTINVHTD